MAKLTPVQKLRQAAHDWAHALSLPVSDATDRAFARIDRRLQGAAIAFAESEARKEQDREDT